MTTNRDFNPDIPTSITAPLPPVDRETIVMEVDDPTDMDTTGHTVTVCTSCAAGIANDDWTHLDLYADCDDESFASVTSFLESAGWLTLLDSHVDTDGYHRCPCCGDDAIDGASFTSDAKPARYFGWRKAF